MRDLLVGRIAHVDVVGELGVLALLLAIGVVYGVTKISIFVVEFDGESFNLLILALRFCELGLIIVFGGLFFVVFFVLFFVLVLLLVLRRIETLCHAGGAGEGCG